MTDRPSNAIPRVLIDEQTIRRRVAELAAQISRDYEDREEVVLVGVLKGAFVFLADLARCLTIPRKIEFIAVSSYEKGTVSGEVRLEMDLRHGVEGSHLLIVEDIVDSGQTLHYLVELLRARGPASIKTCALVRKPARAKVDVQVDYLGFDIPDVWVVGYGLDYAERHRTLPYIGVLEMAV